MSQTVNVATTVDVQIGYETQSFDVSIPVRVWYVSCSGCNEELSFSAEADRDGDISIMVSGRQCMCDRDS